TSGTGLSGGTGMLGLSSTSGAGLLGNSGGLGTGIPGPSTSSTFRPRTSSSLTGTTSISTNPVLASISSYNPFYSSYQNPMSRGMANSSSTQGNFGQPLYGVISTTLPTIGNVPAGMTFNTIGIRRVPGYTTEIAFQYALPPPAQVRVDLQRVLERSTSLASNNGIQVSMDERTVV